MIIDILLLLVLIIWIIIYVKNRKIIITLPYFLILFITPIYNLLDRNVFVNIFGCGCVPSTQSNMFNIDFNANDLRFLVYNIITILMCILGVFFSKKITKKYLKITYVITIIIVNLLLSYLICQLYMWR